MPTARSAPATKPVDGKDLLKGIQRAMAKDVQDRDAKMRAGSVAELVRLADRAGVIVPKS